MFNWFHRWRRTRHRAIFQFWDGRAFRLVDPLVAWRALTNHETFEMQRDLDGHVAGHDDSTQRCLAATRDAFGVSVFDGSQGSAGRATGLTEAETMDLLQAFGEWMQVVKKNTSGQPISPEATPVATSASSTAATNNSADWPSTSDGLNCAAPAL